MDGIGYIVSRVGEYKIRPYALIIGGRVLRCSYRLWSHPNEMNAEGHSNLIGVIADDFTGALDAGVEFVRAGLATTLIVRPEHLEPTPVQVINTNSRDADAAMARQQVTNAARQLLGRRMFKKIDSTMRGHIGAEIQALLGVTGLRKAVVCPAVIEAGRTVRDGQLYVDDVLLHESDFARDPRWPARTSNVASLVGVPATHLDLQTIRSGLSTLTRAIADAPTPVVTLDACCHADLAAIGRAIVAGQWLPCGALGLARTWAGELTGAPHAECAAGPQRANGPILVVAGSRHPNTLAQVDRLLAERSLTSIEIDGTVASWHQKQWATIAEALAAGRSAVIHAQRTEIGEARGRQALVERAGALALRACRECELGGLVLTGGATASAICQTLEVDGVRILGALEVGIPWGKLRGGPASGLSIVTKAGGFGAPDALITIVDALGWRPVE
jgi:D-threonate/D-erythronate kinase